MTGAAQGQPARPSISARARASSRLGVGASASSVSRRAAASRRADACSVGSDGFGQARPPAPAPRPTARRTWPDGRTRTARGHRKSWRVDLDRRWQLQPARGHRRVRHQHRAALEHLARFPRTHGPGATSVGHRATAARQHHQGWRQVEGCRRCGHAVLVADRAWKRNARVNAAPREAVRARRRPGSSICRPRQGRATAASGPRPGRVVARRWPLRGRVLAAVGPRSGCGVAAERLSDRTRSNDKYLSCMYFSRSFRMPAGPRHGKAGDCADPGASSRPKQG